MGLRELRRAKGLTQRELAVRAGISDVKISYLETGKIKVENIMLRTALKLARALECRPEDLLEDKDHASL